MDEFIVELRNLVRNPPDTDEALDHRLNEMRTALARYIDDVARNAAETAVNAHWREDHP